jgi:hypothetical protein
MKKHNRHGGKKSGNGQLRYIHDSAASRVDIDYNCNVVLWLLKEHSPLSILMKPGENPLTTPGLGLELTLAAHIAPIVYAGYVALAIQRPLRPR